MDTLVLTVLDCTVTVECQDAEAYALFVATYCHMQGGQGAPVLSYTVGRQQGTSAFLLTRAQQEPILASDAGDLFYRFERDLTVELQKLRRELYFIHAAALEMRGRACMLVGPSGSGKSTTTWALLHCGFGYLSDELGPIDLQTFKVYPYPHALCLKDAPPDPYPLPAQTLYTSRARYIPISKDCCGSGNGPLPLRAMFFIRYHPEASGPAVHPISTAEAAVYLFAHALNPLAHPGEGLEGAIALAARTACFKLDTAALPATCALVTATLRELLRHEG